MSGPPGAYRTALDLKSAYITYGLTMMHNLRIELADTLRKLGGPPQLTLV